MAKPTVGFSYFSRIPVDQCICEYTQVMLQLIGERYVFTSAQSLVIIKGKQPETHRHESVIICVFADRKRYIFYNPQNICQFNAIADLIFCKLENLPSAIRASQQICHPEPCGWLPFVNGNLQCNAIAVNAMQCYSCLL